MLKCTAKKVANCPCDKETCMCVCVCVRVFAFLQVDALAFDWLGARFKDVGWEGLVLMNVCPRNVNVQVRDRVDCDVVR